MKFIQNLVALMASPWLFEVEGQQDAAGFVVIDYACSAGSFTSLDAVKDITAIHSCELIL